MCFPAVCALCPFTGRIVLAAAVSSVKDGYALSAVAGATGVAAQDQAACLKMGQVQ